MKPFAKRLLALASAAAITLGTIPAVQGVYREDTTYEGVADWALLEVTAMDRLGLIPEELQYADLSREITRQEMCAIAVATCEQVTGSEVPIPEEIPFFDTDDEMVAKAYALGIARGDGNGSFRPDDSLTRAEFFCFVSRYLEASGMMLPMESYSDLNGFTDAAHLPDWAWDSTRLTVGLEIVKGSGSTLDFARSTSGQEALAMFYRAHNASIDFIPAEAFTDLAPWAEASVLRMEQLGLIPDSVKEQRMSGTISRADLCRIAMRSYKMLTWQTDEELGEPEQVFTDTDDVDVLNAYALEIISGRGNGIFDPDSPITRQDFFTVCANFLRALDCWSVDEMSYDLSCFRDADQLAAYAVRPTQVLAAIGAVNGDDTGALNPNREIVSQEAVVIFNRIINFYADWDPESMVPEMPGESVEPEVPEETEPEEPTEPEVYLGETVAEFALQFEGCRYVYGSHGPNKFDCSGLVYYVYKQFGYDLQPGARNQWSTLGSKIKKDDLKPGDLLFFSKNGKASGIFHVGIYIGDGQFIHAANKNKGVIITDIDQAWYAKRYLGAKRAVE